MSGNYRTFDVVSNGAFGQRLPQATSTDPLLHLNHVAKCPANWLPARGTSANKCSQLEVELRMCNSRSQCEMGWRRKRCTSKPGNVKGCCCRMSWRGTLLRLANSETRTLTLVAGCQPPVFIIRSLLLRHPGGWVLSILLSAVPHTVRPPANVWPSQPLFRQMLHEPSTATVSCDCGSTEPSTDSYPWHPPSMLYARDRLRRWRGQREEVLRSVFRTRKAELRSGAAGTFVGILADSVSGVLCQAAGTPVVHACMHVGE